MEDNLKKKMEDNLKKNKNGRQPQFFKTRKTTWKQMEDNLNKTINGWHSHKQMEMEDLIFYLFYTGRQPQFFEDGRILTNSTAQHRQPDQHSNQKYIGIFKKDNWHNSQLT
jgi:hypothetical protein